MITKNKLLKYIIQKGSNSKEAKELVEKNWDYMIRCYGVDIPIKEAAIIIRTNSNF